MLSNLRNIPRIQRGLGWNNGAALLDTWFSRPATAFPLYTAPDTTTIKMAFVLGYARAKSIYDQMVTDKVWSNAAARTLLAERVRLSAGPKNKPFTFGNLSGPVEIQDRNYLNQRSHNNPTLPPWDDLTAALANFNFRVVAQCKLTPVNRAYTVEMSEVGIYVCDSFDFDGFQPLGCWSDNPDRFSPQPVRDLVVLPIGGIPLPIPTDIDTPVFNSTFRDWRNTNGRGGDFLVFSDLKRIPLSPPEVFTIPQ